MDHDAELQEVTSNGKKATYADLEALPENVVGEIVDGELFAMPRPSLEHSVGTSTLGALLLPAFQLGQGGPGGWWILHEPELHLAEDVLVPDLAGWRSTRLEQPRGAAATVAPDWICEALSPSTATLDRVKKMRIYGRERVGHAWLVDPARRSLEVFAREGDEWRPLGVWSGDDRVRAPPFEALELKLELLWATSAPGGGAG
jgi:Uma2 family endonuclease